MQCISITHLSCIDVIFNICSIQKPRKICTQVLSYMFNPVITAQGNNIIYEEAVPVNILQKYALLVLLV